MINPFVRFEGIANTGDMHRELPATENFSLQNSGKPLLGQASAQDPSGSVMAFMMEYQRQLNKEATDDRQMHRQEQAQQSRGFFGIIANFLTGADGGSGNAPVGAPSRAAWNDLKFLKLR